MIDIPDFVYPKDAGGNPICPRCQKLIAQCNCPVIEKPQPKQVAVRPKIRLEKSGRQGKMVTLIEGLPTNEAYLKDLAKKLKVKTGSGGTYYTNQEGGIVEIQGDHREMLRSFFK
jgi:translation initiation factor 1